MKNKFYHPLMYDNITLQDRKVAANFLIKNKKISKINKKYIGTMWYQKNF